MKPPAAHPDWAESPSAPASPRGHTSSVFETFFERSIDAVLLLDPQSGVFVDCNQASLALSGARSKQELLGMRPEELSPPFQMDGGVSAERSVEIIDVIQEKKALLFEWMMRRRDGSDVPIEVSATAVVMDGRPMQVIICRDISERKNAERALVELNQSLERRVAERTAALATSEDRFRALVEHAPDAIVVFDGDTGRFLFGNEHACRLYGVPMEKLTELVPADVSPEFQPSGRRSSELARELMDEALAGGKPVFEWIHHRPNGQLVPTEVRLLRLPDGGRNLIRASIIDNSERKEAERTLRESEEKFRALFEGSSHGVVLHDESEILEVNSASVRIMGCESPQELLGKHPRELAPRCQPNGETSEAAGQKYVEECMTKGSARFEWMALSPRGAEIPLEVALTRIQWSGRQVIQAFITDITRRHRAQAALAESEARFAAAFHASPAFIGILRVSDEKYVLANDAYLNWMGYALDEVVGRSCIELNLWESESERDAVLRALRTVGSVRQMECRWRNRRGELTTVLLSVEPIRLNDTPHMLSMSLDITQRKRAENELLKTLAREKELSQLKSNFVSMVSHEFRTPLGIIQSSAELLREFHPRMEPDEREEQLDSITRNIQRMAGMMEGVLVLSRLDAGKLDYQPAALDLNLFCRRVVDEVHSATNRRCLIELSVDGIPAAAHADEQLLGHIFTNLLSNAVKYSEPGAAVRFTVKQDGNDAVCTVEDRGIGICAEDQQQLFKAFHRGSNVGTRPGTGLGLLVVKRCATLHGGMVEVDSKPGEGTTMTVRLPVFPSP
ncbi:MAG TPA: PAS domain-containing sensor histidine kinase [Verrucomicrobiales bacterium]|nr:PAS domain-containing sensor histidine kinase [Verrucomicrobiales bacterium]